MINSPNIYQRINKIMHSKIYVKKGSAGQGTGVNYDDLIAVLSPMLAENGIVVTAEKYGESRSRTNPKGSYIFESDFAVHYINIDNPEDRFTTIVESHSMDSGDKAPGKAITYATKISMLKVFSVESGDNEESRAEQQDINLITNEQAMELFDLIVDPATNCLTPKGERIAKAYKFNHISEIKAKKFDEILKAAKS